MQPFLPLRKLRLVLVSLLLAASPLLPVIHAAAQGARLATADVPFEFRVGTGKLPAGRYQIVKVNENMLMLRSVDCSHMQTVFINHQLAADIPDHGRLVFHQYGNQYFLADLWMAGNRTGMQLVRGRAETELLNAAVTPVEPPTSTELALNQR